MSAYDVEIVRHPTDEDWKRCKRLALGTMWKEYDGSEVTDEWKRKILKSEHSPIRTLMFTIEMQVPYWVSTHFVRHKYGVEHYVSSQRNDRQDMYDRTKAPQDAMVIHTMDVNAQELMQMARMRLCHKAARETHDVMTRIAREVVKVNPEFDPFLMPKCAYLHECNEFVGCGYYDRWLRSTVADTSDE